MKDKFIVLVVTPVLVYGLFAFCSWDLGWFISEATVAADGHHHSDIDTEMARVLFLICWLAGAAMYLLPKYDRS